MFISLVQTSERDFESEFGVSPLSQGAGAVVAQHIHDLSWLERSYQLEGKFDLANKTHIRIEKACQCARNNGFVA